MRGAAEPGAFSSSNGILCVSFLLLNLSPLEVLFMSSPHCRYTGTTAPCRQKIDPQNLWFASRGFVRRLRLVPRETRKSCKLEFPLPDRQRCRVKDRRSKVCLFYPSLLSGDTRAYFGPAFSRNKTAYSSRQLVPSNARQTATGYMRSISEPVSNSNRLNVIG